MTADSRAPRPRVLMVTGAYYPEISSGGTQCRVMAQQLRDRVDIQVLTTAVDRSLPRYDRVDEVPVTRVRVNVRSGWSKARAFVRMVIELLRLVRAVEIIHIHGYSTKNVLVTIFAKIYRRPLVLSLHTAGFDEPEEIERQGSVALWAFLSVDLYLSVSNSLVDKYLAYGLPADRIRIVPNGIDVDRFRPASGDEQRALREQLGLPMQGPIVMFVGYFSADKQPRVLFDAWLRIVGAPGCRPALIFVGATQSAYFEVDESIAPRMRADAMAQAPAADIRFIGLTHDVPSYLRAADLFVLPSKREGLPVALLEAMACGLACVASRLPGSTDAIIEHGVNGVLTEPGDVDELAAVLTALLPDRERRLRLGAAARTTIVTRYSSETVADRWLEAYAAARRVVR
ncbi:MAG TPA: glycosyltransferase family 4 protein [Vicinamibacterales bacterium]|nr:glycosyltransferase family 4 protein [Vicinamibacterales bacterium]